MRRASRTTIRRVPSSDAQPLKYWQALIELQRGDDGRRRRQAVRSKDLDECRRKLEAALAAQAERVRRPPVPRLPPIPPLLPSGSTGEWLRYWFHDIARADLAPKTAATYASVIRLHLMPSVGPVPLLDLTAADVRAMSAAVRAKGRSGATALHAHRVLSAALAQAHREAYVHRNVALLTKPPRKSRAELRVLSVDDARTIVHRSAHERLGSRWAAAILTGARQGELLGLELDRVGDTLDLSWQLQRLTWSHGCKPFCGWTRGTDCPARRVDAPIDHERRELTGGLWLTRPKSAAGWRVIPLVDPLRALVEARIAASSGETNPYGLVWTMDAGKRVQDSQGRPIDPSTDSKAWHRLLERLGLPDVRLHDARHAAVDLLYEAGAPEVVIRDIVGHAHVEMTRRYRSGRAVAPMSRALAGVADLLTQESEPTDAVLT